MAERGRWEVGEEAGRGRLEVVGEPTRSEGAVAGPPRQPGPRCGQLPSRGGWETQRLSRMEEQGNGLLAGSQLKGPLGIL